MKAGWIRGVVAAVAVVAGMSASSAQAVKFGDLRLTYLRVTESTPDLGEQYGPVIADCNTANGGFPLSGGNSVSGVVGSIWLNTAYPQADQGGSDPDGLPDGWRVFTDNGGFGPFQVGAAVICSPASPEPVYPGTATTANPVGQRSAAAVLCPDGTRVVGGGSLASGLYDEQRTSTSSPFDGADQDSKPDDGWRVRMDNIGLDAETVTAIAICHPASGFSYVTEKFFAKPNKRTKGKAKCPGGTFAVGGGVEGAGPFRSTWIVDHSTSTKFFNGKAKNRGWAARMGIGEGNKRSFEVTTICHS